MDKIEVAVLNPDAVKEAEKNMVFAARLTQRGHAIHTMKDLLTLYEKPYGRDTLEAISELPHPTVQKFSVIPVAVVGASRRFLAQITRHQNEVKFMSASLQYSDYSGQAAFTVPYEILTAGEPVKARYLESCEQNMVCYEALVSGGISQDAAGYAAPHGLRNVLLICATPYQWKHMIHQRVCRRNTDETRIVLLKIWELLYKLNPILFAPQNCGPFCQQGGCREGRMCCGSSLSGNMTPGEILRTDYPALLEAGSP